MLSIWDSDFEGFSFKINFAWFSLINLGAGCKKIHALVIKYKIIKNIVHIVSTVIK